MTRGSWVGNRHACGITDLLQLKRKGWFRSPGQLDKKPIESHEAVGTTTNFDTARSRIELRLRIVRSVVDQVVPVNLPGAIFAGWKAVDFVRRDPPSDHIPVVVAEPHDSRRGISDGAVNAKSQHHV